MSAHWFMLWLPLTRRMTLMGGFGDRLHPSHCLRAKQMCTDTRIRHIDSEYKNPKHGGEKGARRGNIIMSQPQKLSRRCRDTDANFVWLHHIVACYFRTSVYACLFFRSLCSSPGLYSTETLRFAALLLWSWWDAAGWQCEAELLMRTGSVCAAVCTAASLCLCFVSQRKEKIVPDFNQILQTQDL